MIMTKPSPPSYAQSVDIYFRGAYSIDIVLLSFYKGSLQVLLQNKTDVPSQNDIGLPGKLILPNEEVDDAMNSFLHSLLGTHDLYKKQLNAFSKVGRHPLGRVVSFSYYGLIDFDRLTKPLPNNLGWSPLNQLPALAYDHDEILATVLDRFKKGLLRLPTVFELLPKEFILSDIILIYEEVFGKKVDASNFRRQLRKSELLIPTESFQRPKGGIGRPALLYTSKKPTEIMDLEEHVQFNF